MFSDAYILQEIEAIEKHLHAARKNVELATDTKGNDIEVTSEPNRIHTLETSLGAAQKRLMELRHKLIVSLQKAKKRSVA